MFFFLFLQLTVGASLCRMTYVEALTLEGCLHIQYKFSLFLTLKIQEDSKRWVMGMICDMFAGQKLFA